jgi:hypothetical protein
MAEKKNAYMILVEKPDGKWQLGKPQSRWEDTINMDVREIGWGGMGKIHSALDQYNTLFIWIWKWIYR